jgi:RND superfamily putative drug exporter
MRLLGPAAWWAPGPLRRLHRRIGLSETVGEPAATESESGEVPATTGASEH